MAVSDGFRDFVEEQLGRVRPVRLRAMFGGIGVYAGDAFFAVIADDVLYFKVDDVNRPDYEVLELEPFRPFGPGTTPMQYYTVPGDALDDVEMLETWMEAAIAVAERRRRAKRR